MLFVVWCIVCVLFGSGCVVCRACLVLLVRLLLDVGCALFVAWCPLCGARCLLCRW